MNEDTNKFKTLFSIGAPNIAKQERVAHDFYATEPKALEELLKYERFNRFVWEPACGYGETGLDFLAYEGTVRRDIITNPPYDKAQEFVEKALKIIPDGFRIAMFLKIQFLESQKRKPLFRCAPPQVVYVSSNRLHCARNGDFSNISKQNAMCFAWFIWKKGNKYEPILRWFN